MIKEGRGEVAEGVWQWLYYSPQVVICDGGHPEIKCWQLTKGKKISWVPDSKDEEGKGFILSHHWS